MILTVLFYVGLLLVIGGVALILVAKARVAASARKQPSC